MKVNLEGMLANAKGCMKGRWAAFHAGELDDLLADLRDVANGKTTFAEFAEHYCIAPAPEEAGP